MRYFYVNSVYLPALFRISPKKGIIIASRNRRCHRNCHMENSALTVGLSLVFSVVLIGPFLNKWVESNLELFLFVMGAFSATLSHAWSPEVVYEGLVAPINITLAVLGAGVLFHYVRSYVDRGMRQVLMTVRLPIIVCTGIILLGLLSSVISAIIAALLLVEFITV